MYTEPNVLPSSSSIHHLQHVGIFRLFASTNLVCGAKYFDFDFLSHHLFGLCLKWMWVIARTYCPLQGG